MVNHINNYSPTVQVGEFLLVSQILWADTDTDGNYFDSNRTLHRVHDKAAHFRIDLAIADNWIVAGEVLGTTEKLVCLVKVEPEVSL